MLDVSRRIVEGRGAVIRGRPVDGVAAFVVMRLYVKGYGTHGIVYGSVVACQLL